MEGKIPWGVALYIRFGIVDTRMVRFAVIATQLGDRIVHKVVTFPVIIKYERGKGMGRERGGVELHTIKVHPPELVV